MIVDDHRCSILTFQLPMMPLPLTLHFEKRVGLGEGPLDVTLIMTLCWYASSGEQCPHGNIWRSASIKQKRAVDHSGGTNYSTLVCEFGSLGA
jgi:hypothetical protein